MSHRSTQFNLPPQTPPSLPYQHMNSARAQSIPASQYTTHPPMYVRILNAMDGKWHKSCIFCAHEGAEFHSQHLPPNYTDNPKITSRLDSLITSIVKAEKTNLASLIQARLTNGEAAKPLWTLASRINQNRRSIPIQASPKGPKYVWPTFDLYSTSTKSTLPGILNKTPTVWELVDQDLHDHRRNQAQTAKFAFAELIIERNHQLWDGIKTINDIPEEDQQLPTAAKIAARVQQNTPIKQQYHHQVICAPP
ncbi:hypothetical protein VP01_3965g1 [Puccinia sorghi]|uniref:Uncharacterized protein n=1 Tax=Puccinia sorghi TaxID=27349 RepID=A0A0L6UT72_9BASI|nr:hypothetical protein VP01_3965g1 [Puccinia sorghi]